MSTERHWRAGEKLPPAAGYAHEPDDGIPGKSWCDCAKSYVDPTQCGGCENFIDPHTAYGAADASRRAEIAERGRQIYAHEPDDYLRPIHPARYPPDDHVDKARAWDAAAVASTKFHKALDQRRRRQIDIAAVIGTILGALVTWLAMR